MSWTIRILHLSHEIIRNNGITKYLKKKKLISLTSEII